MKKFSLTCIVSIYLMCIGCASIESQDVSLLDYTDKERLISYGLHPNNIALVNKAYKESHGYSRYEGYQKHTIGKFEVLSNPNNSDELYIIKDGNFILDIGKDNTVRLYKKDTKLPNPQEMSIYWIPNRPAAYISSEDKIYYDLNLNGADIDFEKMLYKGDRLYSNYIDIVSKIPNTNIVGANILDNQCKALIGEIACCPTTQGKYQPYQFDYNNGWQVLNGNKKVSAYCNSDDFEQTRRELTRKVFE